LEDSQGNLPATRIEAVFEEFLNDRCGPFDHLTGSNLIAEDIRQDTDPGQLSSPLSVDFDLPLL